MQAIFLGFNILRSWRQKVFDFTYIENNKITFSCV